MHMWVCALVAWALPELRIEGDPTKWGRAASDKPAFDDISLGEVLSHFQDDAFVDTELPHMAMVGFNRYNPRFGENTVKYPYKRTHVYSAVIMNVVLLQKHKLLFNKGVYLWEDLDFNERVNEANLLICKCQRFCQRKKQLSTGGANYMIADGRVGGPPQTGGGPASSTKPSAPAISTWEGSPITTGAPVGGEGKRPRSPTGRTPDQPGAKKPTPAPELDEVAQFFDTIKGIPIELRRQFAQKCIDNECLMETLRMIGEQKYSEGFPVLKGLLGYEKLGPVSTVWFALKALLMRAQRCDANAVAL
jgi:hypothetical protein